MRISRFTAQNKRDYQEDRSFVLRTKNEGTIFGIFDGHENADTSEYAATNAPLFFKKIKDKSDPAAVLTKLFKKLIDGTKTNEGGSTATIVWIKDDIAHVGVLGDSLVLIKTPNEGIWKSPEHNVRSNASEAEDALARGGLIYKGYLFDKNNTSLGGLQMSRALGDSKLDAVLLREPEIFHIPINEDSWILGCSDGLVNSAHNMGHILFSMVTGLVESNATAKKLITEIAKMDDSDNSTAVLVRFKGKNGEQES